MLIIASEPVKKRLSEPSQQENKIKNEMHSRASQEFGGYSFPGTSLSLVSVVQMTTFQQ